MALEDSPARAGAQGVEYLTQHVKVCYTACMLIELTAPGLVAQSLRRDAEAQLRESRSRALQGPHLAPARQAARDRAKSLLAQADAIETQLRARTARQAA